MRTYPRFARFAAIGLVGLALLPVGTPAFAQVPDYGPSAGGASSGSPKLNWNDLYNAQLPESLSGWARESAISSVNAAMAREDLARAESRLSGMIASLRKQLEESPEMRAAMKNLEQARARFEAARDKVLQSVRETKEYKSAAELAEGPARVLAAGNLSPRDRMGVARRKLEAQAEVSRLEAEALKANSDVRDARAALVEAGQKLSDLRAQAEQTLRSSPEIAAARQQVAEAREAYGYAVARYAGALAGYDQEYWQQYPRRFYSSYPWAYFGTTYGGYRWR